MLNTQGFTLGCHLACLSTLSPNTTLLADATCGASQQRAHSHKKPGSSLYKGFLRDMVHVGPFARFHYLMADQLVSSHKAFLRMLH